jgi:DNA-binding Lrp family transcriptional regulator
MKEWSFLTNHGLVLSYVADHKRITSREIATALRITERRVQRIISDLEQSGYITKTRSGRHNTYVVNTDLPLRHPTQPNRPVKELLVMLKPLPQPATKKKLMTHEMQRLIPDITVEFLSEQTKGELTPSVLVTSPQDESAFVPEPRPML